MSNSQEAANQIRHVSVRKPSAFDLSRILRTQTQHRDRLIACINKDSRGTIMNEVVDPQNKGRVDFILSSLKDLRPEATALGEVIVYCSSSKE